MPRFDALIVGAGPAGAACARLLAQAGLRVALVEKAEFPRQKVCGAFISAPTWPVLAACGVGEAFAALAGPVVTQVAVYAGAARIIGPQQRAWGRALGREHLDTLLRDAALAAGAALYQPAELTAVARDGAGFSCTIGGETLLARHVIAACGSWIPKGIFAVPEHSPRSSDLFAFKAHFRAAQLPAGLMPLLAFPGGYGGLVAADGGRLSLSCCIRRDALMRARQRHGGKASQAVIAHIAETTLGVREALKGSKPEGTFLSVGPIHPGIRPRLKDGIFFTGNSAGEAHPVIAEGISMAIQSSGLLAELLVAGKEADYSALWRRRFAPRIWAASLFAHLAMSDMGRVTALRMLQSAPGLISWGAQLSGKSAISA